MLSTIRKFDRKTREGLLADLALDLSHPGVLDRPENPDFKQVYQQLVDEIRRTLQLAPDDKSETSSARIYELINREIRQLALDTGQIKKVRNRLGHSGLLPAEQYQIVFQDEFRDLCEPMGISRTEVSRSITRPTRVEHFLPEQYGQNRKNALTLFLKTTPGDSASSLLVAALRDGALIRVTYAIRVFHTEVDVLHAREPIDFLSIFLQKFGMDFTVGNKRARFVVYETVPVNPGVSKSELFSITPPDNRLYDSQFTFRRSGDIWEIALAYAVDLVKYADMLRRHGVKVTRLGSLRST